MKIYVTRRDYLNLGPRRIAHRCSTQVSHHFFWLSGLSAQVSAVRSGVRVGRDSGDSARRLRYHDGPRWRNVLGGRHLQCSGYGIVSRLTGTTILGKLHTRDAWLPAWLGPTIILFGGVRRKIGSSVTLEKSRAARDCSRWQHKLIRE